MNKKATISLRLNNIVNKNNYYTINNIVNDIGGKNTLDSRLPNLDYSIIKQNKTEYIISDLEDYKKGFLYENSIDNKKNKENQDIKATFYFSKNKDKKYLNILKSNLKIVMIIDLLF